MIIYDAELDIAEAIKNNSIALNLTTQVVNHELDFKAEASANPYQIDLFYLKSVLVSLGWNQNDDVFDKRETLAARHTPIDKQFNFMHNEKDIIGHITSAKIWDGEQYLSEDSEGLPEKFDIIVGSVIYKNWQSDELQERMNKLIAEIKENKWFVSMECYFRNFDYALISNGSTKVIARNKDTAFLTKYLRAYGGSGEFKGDKIGRLLRDFSFSGKGLVDNPANKRSVILDYSDISEETTSAKEIVMADNTYTKEQYDAIVTERNLAVKSAQETADKAKAKEMDELKAEITILTNKNAELVKTGAEVSDKLVKAEKELSVSNEVSQNKDTQIKTLQDESAKLTAKVKEQDEVLQKATVEKTKADRLAKFTNKEVDAAKAQSLVEKFITVSNEMFDEVVNSIPDKKNSTKVASATILEDYETDPEPTLSTANVDTAKAEETKGKVSAWLKSTINTKKGDK